MVFHQHSEPPLATLIMSSPPYTSKPSAYLSNPFPMSDQNRLQSQDGWVLLASLTYRGMDSTFGDTCPLCHFLWGSSIEEIASWTWTCNWGWVELALWKIWIDGLWWGQQDWQKHLGRFSACTETVLGCLFSTHQEVGCRWYQRNGCEENRPW